MPGKRPGESWGHPLADVGNSPRGLLDPPGAGARVADEADDPVLPPPPIFELSDQLGPSFDAELSGHRGVVDFDDVSPFHSNLLQRIIYTISSVLLFVKPFFRGLTDT